jgi:tRNA(fMet)-specific endonuclease VapC
VANGNRKAFLVRSIYGAFKSRRSARNIGLVDALQFAVIEFDNEDARKSCEVRAFLASKGTPIWPYDVLIAGQAIARNMILITHNTDEFGRLPGLQIDD